MKNNIGVMQGRLLPKFNGLYQAHPKDYWQEEFEIAKNLGLDSIEFILDFNFATENPLLTQNGISEIQELSNYHGVQVKTICADYFMIAPLHSEKKYESLKSQKILVRLLKNSKKLGVTDIVIPCVDQSSLNSTNAENLFIKSLTEVLPFAEDYEINLSLETDLNPKSFIRLLNRFQSERVKVNYDIGNSASLGFDPVQELDSYGHKISDIHIKDRTLNGGPVLLGKGDANFKAFFDKLKEFNYSGPFIMQAYRDEEGVKLFKRQLDWIKPYLMQ